MERHKGRNFEEIMGMLQVLTPLEETRAYQQLVGIGIEKGKKEGQKEGRQEEARAMLRNLLARRFGKLPAWANARLKRADTAQLEVWAVAIFDAASLEELLGRE